MGLDAAQLGGLDPQLDGADTSLFKQRCDVRPRFRHELVGEKIAVAINDAQTGRFIFDAFHMFLQFRKRKIPVIAGADPRETGQNGKSTPRRTGFAGPEASVFLKR
jgi:hypothetical protein